MYHFHCQVSLYYYYHDHIIIIIIIIIIILIENFSLFADFYIHAARFLPVPEATGRLNCFHYYSVVTIVKLQFSFVRAF